MKLLININKFLISNVIAMGSIIALGGIVFSVTANPLGKLSDQWYVGGSLGVSDLDPDGGNTWKTDDGKDISKKIYVGTDISRQIGLEAFWTDLGNAKMKSKTGDTGKVHYKAIGANVVYNSPVKILGVRPLGKLGVAKFSNKDKGSVHSKQNNKLTLFGGVGAEFDLTKNLKVRSEYEYFDKDISNLSVGLNWSPSFRDHSFISQQNRVNTKPVVAEKNIVNVYVPPQPVVQPRPIIIQPPKPRVVYKTRPTPKPRIVYKTKPAPAPLYKTVHKTLSGGSHFNSGSSKLTLNGQNALKILAQDLRGQNVQSIRIVGHTDSIGSERSNLALSYARANAVANYLVSQGINRQIINTQGLGETQPIADNRTERGRALNRRVEITVKSKARIRIR